MYQIFFGQKFPKAAIVKTPKRGSRLHEIGAAEHMADKKLVKLQGEQLLRDHVRLTWASAIFIDDHRAHLLWKRGLLFCSANNLFDNSGNPIKNQQTYHFYICLNLISSLVSRKTFLEKTHFPHDYSNFHLDLVSEYYDTNGSDMKFFLFTVASLR